MRSIQESVQQAKRSTIENPKGLHTSKYVPGIHVFHPRGDAYGNPLIFDVFITRKFIERPFSRNCV